MPHATGATSSTGEPGEVSPTRRRRSAEPADVALMADDPSKLPCLYALSGTADGVVRQNIRASIGVKALLAVGVPSGW